MRPSSPSEWAVHRAVRAVKLRQLLLQVVHGLNVGILTGAIGYLLWAWTGEPRWGWVLGGAAMAAILRTLRLRATAPDPAHHIDEALDLKDRVASATEFSGMTERGEIHALQIHDAAERVRDLSVARVAPWAWRRDVVLVGISAGLWVIGQMPRGVGDVHAMPAPAPPALVQEAETVAGQLEELAEELAGSEADELNRMLDELKEQVESLANPGSNLESALQTLGQIRNALEEVVTAMDLAVDEALLAAMAEALQLAEPTRAAARALADGDLERAARELDQAAAEAALPENQFADQAQALANPMDALARRAGEAGNRELSEALANTAESIRSGDGQACSDALREQADATRRTGARRRLADSLQDQLQQLAGARQRMTDAYCEACMQGSGACEGEQGGGDCASRGMSLAEGEDATSAGPSESAGMGTHDAPFGEATDLDSRRVQEQLSGQMGTGPSEFTLELAPQFDQQASREYREVYTAYRKLSAQALEQEPIPAAHQGIIQTYFESIRPAENAE